MESPLSGSDATRRPPLAALAETLTSETLGGHSGALKNRFDRSRVEREINAQVEATLEATQGFGRTAPQLTAALSDHLGHRRTYEQAEHTATVADQALADPRLNPEDRRHWQTQRDQAQATITRHGAAYRRWREGGTGRALLQAGVGGLLSGTPTGAVAAGATSLSAPALNRAGQELGGLGKTLLDLGAGAAIGAASGGGLAAAAAGANSDWHNRQLHPREAQLIQEYANNHAQAFAKDHPGMTKEQARKQLTNVLASQALIQVDSEWARILKEKTLTPAYAQEALQTLARKHPGHAVGEGKPFDARGTPAFNDHTLYSNYLTQTKAVYDSDKLFLGHKQRPYNRSTVAYWTAITKADPERWREMSGAELKDLVETGIGLQQMPDKSKFDRLLLDESTTLGFELGNRHNKLDRQVWLDVYSSHMGDAVLMSLGGRMLGRGVAKSVTPNVQQAVNLKRFQKKIPSNSKNSVEFRKLPNGGIAAQATSPGKVPGSKAVYEKQIDVNGKTIQATKTTYDSQGNIVHVKDKLNGGTYP